MRIVSASLVAVVAATVASAVRADVKLPAIISDHMVVQSEASVPIWGWADQGEQVKVTLAGQSQSATAGDDGRWTVTFTGLPAGGPHVLSIEGKNSLNVNDVLIGEVWLGSGQSNMAMVVQGCLNVEEEKSAANLPHIRMFTVERNSQPSPQKDCNGKWEIANAKTVGRFSATLYFFGRSLHKELNVPVGLINASWGGTPIEAWTSMPAQSKLEEFATIAAPWEQQKAKPWDQAKADAAYEKAMAGWRQKSKEAKAAGKPAARAPQKQVDPRLNQNHPANLFNGMIEPLVPYAFRGAIWYQGESNAGKEFRNLYGLQLQTLIEDWRLRFGHEFPFAWVQLPDFREPQKTPNDESTWAIVREQMLETLKTPKTGMAVTLGLGDEKDIHPKNKQEVGKRLAMWALHDVYGRKTASCGPLPVEHEIRGKEVVVSFTHTEGGLKAHTGELKGFAIAGDDKTFVWADARIEGNKVIVSSKDVAAPKAVRYAWADNPVWSLENAAGLPASPFRTDDW
jgi:sialate O-acetylesterase